MAALHGLPSPDPATARVLEIGCGAGGNLIAMAVATPGIRALGIDLAAAPIAEGRAAIEAVGIDNVELRQGDVCDLRDGQLGEFDYVIAHGVYAWVPEPVRDALLAAIHSHLAADGLAYVSYNANPGGYMRRALREAGLWYAGDAAAGVEQAERARELFRFLSRTGRRRRTGGAGCSRTSSGVGLGPPTGSCTTTSTTTGRPCGSPTSRRARPPTGSPTSASPTSHLLPAGSLTAVAERPRRVLGWRPDPLEQLSTSCAASFFRQSVLCRDSRTASDARSPRCATLHYAARPASRATSSRPGCWAPR